MAKKKTRTRGARRTGRGLATASVAALKAELDRRIELLQARREELVAEIEELDEEMDTCGDVAPPRRARVGRPPKKRPVGRPRKKRSAGRPPVAGKRKRGRPRSNNSLTASLKRLLRNKTMSVSEMAEAVQKAGYKTNSPNFRTIVNQALIGNKTMFKRVARGQYTAK